MARKASTRLPGEKYARVFREGRPVKGRLMISWGRPGLDSCEEAGVIVTKRTFRRATERNRAKRLLREAYRLLVKERRAPREVEWVFIGRFAMRGLSVEIVKDEMAWAIRRWIRYGKC